MNDDYAKPKIVGSDTPKMTAAEVALWSRVYALRLGSLPPWCTIDTTEERRRHEAAAEADAAVALLRERVG